MPVNFFGLKLFLSEIVGSCLTWRVLKCYAQCYGVMEIGKRGVKNGWVDGGERVYWWGFWGIVRLLRDLITCCRNAEGFPVKIIEGNS
jgi:hypothetical protein